MDRDLEARARARVGRVINQKYRIDTFLGLGGMASVFAATHRNGHRVALKMLHHEHSALVTARAMRP